MKMALPAHTNIGRQTSQADAARALAQLKAEIRRCRRWVIATLILLYGILLPVYMWTLAPLFGLR